MMINTLNTLYPKKIIMMMMMMMMMIIMIMMIIVIIVIIIISLVVKIKNKIKYIHSIFVLNYNKSNLRNVSLMYIVSKRK